MGGLPIDLGERRVDDELTHQRDRQLSIRQRDELGVGLIPLTWGVLIFFMFLTLAVQVAITLYATSTVSALGHDAARRAAGAGASPAAIAEAEGWFRAHVGPSVDVVSMDWSTAGGALSLSIVVTPPDLLIGRTGLVEPIERTFVVRVEELQPLSAGP